MGRLPKKGCPVVATHEHHHWREDGILYDCFGGLKDPTGFMNLTYVVVCSDKDPHDEHAWTQENEVRVCPGVLQDYNNGEIITEIQKIVDEPLPDSWKHIDNAKAIKDADKYARIVSLLQKLNKPEDSDD